MSRRKPTAPLEILSADGKQKAALTSHNGAILADYYRHCGAVNGTSSYWKWDRQAEVRVQPLTAALAVIQRIVNTPFPQRR